MEKVKLVDKLALFTDHWRPKIVGELNSQQVKLAKFQGEFVWHHHDDEDELFLVVKLGMNGTQPPPLPSPASFPITRTIHKISAPKAPLLCLLL